MKNSEMGIKEQSFGAKFWKQSRNLWSEGLRLRFWKSSRAPAMIQQSHSIRNFQRERERERKRERKLWAYYRAVGLNHQGGLPWICTKTVEFFLSLSLSSLVCLGNWNEMGILNLEPPHKAVFTFYEYYMRMPKGRRI